MDSQKNPKAKKIAQTLGSMDVSMPAPVVGSMTTWGVFPWNPRAFSLGLIG